MEFTIIASLVHKVCNLSKHPYHTEYMICMPMSDKHIMKAVIVTTDFFKLGKDLISAARIGEEIGLIRTNHEARIITMCNHSIACTKHNEFFHVNSPCHLL